MAQNYIESGDQVEVVLTSGQTGFASGSPYKVGSQIGIILSLTREGQTVFTGTASAAGDRAIVRFEGVFTVAKEAPLVIALGDRLYWDATASKFTKTAAGNTFAGFAHEAALSADTTVKIRLWQGDATGDSAFSQAAVVAAETTANGSDASTTQALANALKTKVNAILTSLKDAGLMASS